MSEQKTAPGADDLVERVAQRLYDANRAGSLLPWKVFKHDYPVSAEAHFKAARAIIPLVAEEAAKVLDEKARIAALADNTARTDRRVRHYQDGAAAIRAKLGGAT